MHHDIIHIADDITHRQEPRPCKPRRSSGFREPFPREVPRPPVPPG